MNLIDKKITEQNTLDTVAIYLQRCLNQHKNILVEHNSWPDMARLRHLTGQVRLARDGDPGNVGDPSVLIEQGLSLIEEARDRILEAHEEQQRAQEEFPAISRKAEKLQRDYTEALHDVNCVYEHFCDWLESMKAPNQKGSNEMKIVKPQEDGKTTDIGIKNYSRTEIADALSAMLASTYSLYVKSLFYHWNVTGAQFHGLHALFEEHYQNLHEAGDEIAERIRSLGYFTPGSLQAFASLSVVKDDEHLPGNADGMLENLQAAHELCAGEARSVMKIAAQADDEVTADMMIERMAFHDQAIWMLSASRS